MFEIAESAEAKSENKIDLSDREILIFW